MYDQEYACFDEIYFDDRQEFPMLMDLTVTAGCWINFYK